MVLNILIRLLRFFLGLFVKPLIEWAFSLYHRKTDKARPLPQIKHPILLLPANKIASKIRNKEVSIKIH